MTERAAIEERVRGSLGRLKVFPLPAAALLPGAAMGMHVFEPRYRALTRQALESGGVFCVAQLAPGWESDYEGRPPLRPLAGAGVIERWHRHADGRYDLLVRGVARVRLLRELPPEHPFREFEAELVPDAGRLAPGAPDLVRHTVIELCRRLPPEESATLMAAAAGERDPGRLCDLTLSAATDDAQRLQAALEAVDLSARLSLVLSEVAGVLASKPSAKGGLLA